MPDLSLHTQAFEKRLPCTLGPLRNVFSLLHPPTPVQFVPLQKCWVLNFSSCRSEASSFSLLHKTFKNLFSMSSGAVGTVGGLAMCHPTVSPEGRHHRGHPKNSLITTGWTTVLSVCLLIKFQGRVPFLANSIVNMTLSSSSGPVLL